MSDMLLTSYFTLKGVKSFKISNSITSQNDYTRMKYSGLMYECGVFAADLERHRDHCWNTTVPFDQNNNITVDGEMKSQERAITKNIILRIWKNELLKKRIYCPNTALCNIIMNILTEGKDNRRQEAEGKKKSCRCPSNPNTKHTSLLLPCTIKTVLFLAAYEPRFLLPGTENNLLHENVNLFHGTLHWQ